FATLSKTPASYGEFWMMDHIPCSQELECLLAGCVSCHSRIGECSVCEPCSI
ncbi:hypothetical protein SK128_002373, partial [Halocaridina rubra]